MLFPRIFLLPCRQCRIYMTYDKHASCISNVYEEDHKNQGSPISHISYCYLHRVRLKMRVEINVVTLIETLKLRH